MMNVPPSEAKALAWWEYQAMLWTWNDRHTLDDQEEPAEAPDADFVARRMARLEERGLARSVH